MSFYQGDWQAAGSIGYRFCAGSTVILAPRQPEMTTLYAQLDITTSQQCCLQYKELNLQSVLVHDVVFIFAGFSVGFMIGLTGVGGGPLMTPILTFAFGGKPVGSVDVDSMAYAGLKRVAL